MMQPPPKLDHHGVVIRREAAMKAVRYGDAPRHVKGRRAEEDVVDAPRPAPAAPPLMERLCRSLPVRGDLPGVSEHGRATMRGAVAQ